MDVLIKEMEMPKSCEECPLFFEYFSKLENKSVFHCRGRFEGESRFADDFDWHTRPSEGCPLVELPPHGEAKDTDIAIRYIKGEMEDDFNETTTLDEKSYKEGMKRAIELIGYAPTVLEANYGSDN